MWLILQSYTNIFNNGFIQNYLYKIKYFKSMKKNKINIFSHYRKLIFFNFFRFKGNNYNIMSEYFAKILIQEIEEYMPLINKKVLDIGGAKGFFCKVLNDQRHCDAINIDPNPGEFIWPKTIVGMADSLPFENFKFDCVISRGVLEHVPIELQQKSINEMYRVVKKGGVGYILIPPWYNPHAGHSLKPFHVLPFKLAKFFRELFFRDKINTTSFAETGLYPITFSRMLKMISKSGFKLIATKDTHFRLHFITKIPIAREILVPAVAFFLVKE